MRNSFLITLLWSSSDDSGEPLDCNYSISDIDNTEVIDRVICQFVSMIETDDVLISIGNIVNNVVSFERFTYDCKHGTRQQHKYLTDNNCTFDRMEGMIILAMMANGELIDISPSAVYISLHFNSNAEYKAYYFGK